MIQLPNPFMEIKRSEPVKPPAVEFKRPRRARARKTQRRRHK